MIKEYFPYGYAKSVFAIDYEKLYKMGYRGLILDIDNTFVHHGDDPTPETDELIRKIQATGFRTLFMSNNDEERVTRFLKNISSMYICEADKPAVKNYKKAVEMLGMKNEEVVCIGDQTFVDIIGANRSGIPSILVRFIRLDSEKKIGKKRYIEMAILFIWRRLKKYNQRIGDIEIKE